MTFAPDWQQDNPRHLALALGELRLRLQRAAKAARPKPAEAAPEQEKSLEGMLAEVRQKRQELEEAMDPPPALHQLRDRLALSPFEADVVLLCAGMELDTRVAALCAAAQGAHDRTYPTFGLALTLFDDPDWSALTPQRPLRALRLIEIHQPAATALIAATLRIDERVVHYLKGINQLDDRLAALLAPVPQEDHQLPPSQRAVAQAVVRGWEESSADGAVLPVVQLAGPDPASKLLVASQAAGAVGRHLCRLPVEHLPEHAGEIEGVARLWQRESRLLPLALYLDADGEAGEAAVRAARRFLTRDDSLVFLAVREPIPLSGRPGLTLEVDRPSAAEQKAAWTKALGPVAGQAAGLLAGQFSLNLPEIHRTARAAQARGEGPGMVEAAWAACREAARPRVPGLAQRLDARARWGDLMVPAVVERQLRQLTGQVRHRSTVYAEWGFGRASSRGLGISVLFCGASGTGKTMAAEVIANELGLDLYRIDLSAVIDKYIGETEKNLRRLFDAFEESGAVLFFDEADALFGKRTEVRDSHDRYANVEVSYLLQRMESYRGLAVLATNFKSALDPAFLRRLRFVVEFPAPAAAERRRIWENVFPSGEGGVPTEGLEHGRLARLDLTGGNIYSAALNAAFRAAEGGRAVTMADVMAAARDEYRKLERQVHESEFRWEEGGA